MKIKQVNIYQQRLSNIRDVLLKKKSDNDSIMLNKQIDKILLNLKEVDNVLDGAVNMGDELNNYQDEIKEYFDYIEQIERFII